MYCESRDYWKLLQSAAISSSITYSVEHASCESLIPFPLEANYRLLRSYHFFLLSSSTPSGQQQISAPKTPADSWSVSKQSRATGTSSNAPPAGTLQQCTYHLVHHYATNAGTDNMIQYAHFGTICIARSN